MTTNLKDEFKPAFFERNARKLHTFCRLYFRYQVRGFHQLPQETSLLVGNHSALGMAELMCMTAGWWQHFGTRRRVTGMMHDFFIAMPVVGHYYRAIGAVPANRGNAQAALNAGHDVVVFPGGDLDACRPFYEPREVHFGKRRGYIHVALRAGVPIVPMATIGSHYTWPMAPGGAFLARALGLKALLRSERIPLPMTPMLLPARITTEFLPPIDAVAVMAGEEDEAAGIEKVHALVHGALVEAVRHMEHDRPHFPA